MTDLQYLLEVKNGKGMICLPEYPGEPIEDRWEPAPAKTDNPNRKKEKR